MSELTVKIQQQEPDVVTVLGPLTTSEIKNVAFEEHASWVAHGRFARRSQLTPCGGCLETEIWLYIPSHVAMTSWRGLVALPLF